MRGGHLRKVLGLPEGDHAVDEGRAGRHAGTGYVIKIEQIEAEFGLPAREWTGKCYQVACAAAELVEGGEAVYGHYLGPVHESSVSAGRAAFVQHGWVLLPDGRILDPTRWAFEGREPYLYVGENDHYDEGGNGLRTAFQGGPPEFNPEDRTYEITQSMLPSGAWGWMEKALGLDGLLLNDGYEPGTVSLQQLHWIANMDPRSMEGHAKDVYAMLERLGLEAHVPFDNWNMVEKGRA